MAVDTPLLRSSCSILGTPLWRSRAHLYETYIELSGWTWTGRVVRRVSLETIASVRWWGGKCDINLELTLNDGRVVALYLEESAGTWNYTLRRLLRVRKQESSPSDPSDPTSAEGEASTHDAQDATRSSGPDLSVSGDGASERNAPNWVGIAPS
jgi:hypothetical protein